MDEAIEFYQQALGAELLYRGTMPNGLTLHAQLRVGASFILLSDEMMSHGEIPTGSPLKLGGTSALAMPKEAVTPEELHRRMVEHFSEMQST